MKRRVGTLLAGLMLVSAMALPVSAANTGSTQLETEVPEEWTLTIPMNTVIPYSQESTNIDGHVYVSGNITNNTKIGVFAAHTPLRGGDGTLNGSVIDYNLSSDLYVDKEGILSAPENASVNVTDEEWNDFLEERFGDTFTVATIPNLTDSYSNIEEIPGEKFARIGIYNATDCNWNKKNPGNPYLASNLTATVTADEWEKANAGTYTSQIIFVAAEIVPQVH